MKNKKSVEKIYDMHVHYKGGRHAPPSDLNDFISGMDESGVDVSLLLPFDGLHSNCKEDNDIIASTVNALPSRLCGMGVVNPRDTDCFEEMERCLKELKLIGIKLHPWLQAFSPFDPKYIALAEHASFLKSVLFFHDGTPPYTESLAIAESARMFPDLTIVFGHAGLNDLWYEALIALKKYDNIWVCTCGCPYYGLQRIAEATNGERILFGSDYPLANARDVTDRINRVDFLKISDENKEKILYKNAEIFIKTFSEKNITGGKI